AGGDGGAVDHGERKIGCDRAGSVEHLAPACSNNHARFCLARGLRSAIDLGGGALAAEMKDLMAHASIGKCLRPRLRKQADGAAAGEDEGRSLQPEVANFMAKLFGRARTLRVAGGSAKDFE